MEMPGHVGLTVRFPWHPLPSRNLDGHALCANRINPLHSCVYLQSSTRLSVLPARLVQVIKEGRVCSAGATTFCHRPGFLFYLLAWRKLSSRMHLFWSCNYVRVSSVIRLGIYCTCLVDRVIRKSLFILFGYLFELSVGFVVYEGNVVDVDYVRFTFTYEFGCLNYLRGS